MIAQPDAHALNDTSEDALTATAVIQMALFQVLFVPESCTNNASLLPTNPATRQTVALSRKNRNAPAGNTSVEYCTISSETDDIVVKAPKNPMKRSILFAGPISKKAKEMKQMRKHPMKLAANTPHDNGSSDGNARVSKYLETAPAAPPTATIKN